VSAPAVPPLRAVDLRTERVVTPLAVAERHPLFSWRLPPGTTSRQGGFRLRVVAGDGDPRDESVPAVWDSGEVDGWSGVDVPYAGPAIPAAAVFGWSVRVRPAASSEEPAPGEWADPASFETAPTDLGTDLGTTAWLTTAAELDRAPLPLLDPHRFTPEIQRIWAPGGCVPGSSAVFETDVVLPDGASVTSVQLLAAGAADIGAFVGDAEIAVDGRVDRAGARPWTVGRNRLRLVASAAAGEVPGLLVSGLVNLTAGGPVPVGSDDRWRVSTDGASGWRLAERYGANGDAPRGRETVTHRPSPYLRRAFDVPTGSPVVRARLHATALGVYLLTLNGARVGRHELAPGWTDYRQRLPFQTYDVTDLLRTGDNVLGAVLGDGWFAGYLGWLGPFRYGTTRALLARLEVEHADGSRTVVGTDEAWKAGTGALRFSDQQLGDVVEPAATPTGWDEPGFDDAGWAHAVVTSPAHGRLEAEVNPPIAVAHTLPAASITRRDDGRILLDFGQNLVGRVRLRLTRRPAGPIIVAHAERLDDAGELYVDALRSARCTDEFRATDAALPVQLAPVFSWRGFQYAEVHGWPGELEPDGVTAEVLHAAMTPIGKFSCSDERLNQLQHNIVWGQRGNFLSVPTDCPQRDERLGWTGDAQAFATTAAFNYDVRGFFRKWMRDLRDAQGGNGAVTHVAPDPLSPAEPGFSARAPSAAGSAGWGDAVVIVPHALYQTYGDIRLVQESLSAIGAWIDYLRATSVDGIRGEVDGVGPASGFGDWLAITDTPKDLVATAFAAYAARLAAELAADLGEPARVSEWAAAFAGTRRAFRRRWVRGGGRIDPQTQTGYVLALHVGLFEPDEEPAAVERLVRDIESRNDHLATGFLGTPYLLQVLAAHGRADVAHRLLLQESYPSWLYPVVSGGATTMWERWDSWSDSRGFGDPGMTSFNHYAYGCVGEWLYRGVAGLVPGGAGYAHTVVRPYVVPGLTWAQASLDTVHGPLRSRWELDGETLHLHVSIPPNGTGEVWVPRSPVAHADAGVPVGPGQHDFTVAWTA